MSDHVQLYAATDRYEGYKAAAYPDSRSLWTFGRGRCLETHPLTGPEWKRLLDNGWISVSITPAGATWLEREELAYVERILATTWTWWASLNDPRQNALIELGYQMGLPKLFGFRLMIAACIVGDWEEAYRQAVNSDWYREMKAAGSPRADEVANQLRTGSFAAAA